ncbi:MBOAT family protein [Trinickia symbiotica]|uniref:Probable alginate O-acetylase AlgI n=1 Tax=Trinickia symbiotica TaxID=863227 RepID=A0A2T3Y0A0_9BURK|nr:MBOAT family protein [Trinickia symbiotica]PTB22189.1 MBOAT family protein [Trinickia symbiotica]
MIFSSIVFLGLFLPVTFFSYYLVPVRWRNVLLAIASVVFYAWGEPRYVILMIVSVAANFSLAIAIDRATSRRVLLLTAAVALNLVLLGVFKYGNFVVDNVDWLLERFGVERIVLKPIDIPIGISFYTFHAISYLIDIYRRNVKPNRSIVEYSLYIMLFPQLVAGPIIRYKDVHTQLARRACSIDDVSAGIVRFTMGLSKKVLIANQLGLVADTAFNVPGDQLGPAVAWLGLVCYTLQLYFDFSGYSDMAIGLARMFGFRFPENFDYPYTATSIQDFWRRWHISLSTWFRDYIYIPLGGNRRGEGRTLVNLWTVFLLTGLWHGASWNFVIWGAIHGFFLMMERLTRNGGRLRLAAVPVFVRRLYAVLVVMFAWVFFRAASLEQALQYLQALVGHWPKAQWTVSAEQVCSQQTGILLVVAAILAGGFYPWLARRSDALWRGLARRALDGWARLVLVTPALILSSMSLALGQYNPFIYFRF